MEERKRRKKRMVMVHKDDIGLTHGWFPATAYKVEAGDELITWSKKTEEAFSKGQLFKGVAPYRSDCKTKIKIGEIVYNGSQAFRFCGVIDTYVAGETGGILSRSILMDLIQLERVPDEDLITVTLTRSESNGGRFVLGPRVAQNFQEVKKQVLFLLAYGRRNDGGVHEFKIEVKAPTSR